MFRSPSVLWLCRSCQDISLLVNEGGTFKVLMHEHVRLEAEAFDCGFHFP